MTASTIEKEPRVTTPQGGGGTPVIPVSGVVDVGDKQAHIRTDGYLPSPGDVYVSLALVRRHDLRTGDRVAGAARPPRREKREKSPALLEVHTVNGLPAENTKRPHFADLTPLYPQERLHLANGDTAGRIVDLVSPVGKGQRGLIVSPPKAGKTIILQAMAHAIATNHPEVDLMVVLIDERPEEVTDMQRSIGGNGEVIFSTFDRPATEHITVAELAIERAKRLVEAGRDVVVLLDSITRLGRAYNLAAPNSSRILTGGVASTAIHPPKRFLGAARNIENGGSLTILATALIETGSTMDTVLFEEFKSTGNMELRLRRDLAEKRVFPAVSVNESGSRRDDLIMSDGEYEAVSRLRRALGALDPQEAVQLLIEKTAATADNEAFLREVRASVPTQR